MVLGQIEYFWLKVYSCTSLSYKLNIYVQILQNQFKLHIKLG